MFSCKNREEINLLKYLPMFCRDYSYQGLKDENCTVIENMLSVNLSKEHTLAALDRLYDIALNITDKKVGKLLISCFINHYQVYEIWTAGGVNAIQ
jgi:hypothetical protein